MSVCRHTGVLLGVGCREHGDSCECVQEWLCLGAVSCAGVLLGVLSPWTCCTSVLQSECGCVSKCTRECAFTLGVW